MEFRIADTFTNSLSRLTGSEQKAQRRRQWVAREETVELRYDRAVKLGLSPRIRLDASSLETTPKTLPSAKNKKHPPAETSPRSPS